MKKIFFLTVFLIACNQKHEIVGLWIQKFQNLKFQFNEDNTCITEHIPTGQTESANWYIDGEILSIINTKNDTLKMYYRIIQTDTTEYIQLKNMNQSTWGPEFYRN